MSESEQPGNDGIGPTDGDSISQASEPELIIVDPTSGRTGAASGSDDRGSGTGRRRGRPAGTRHSKEGKASLDGLDIRAVLISIHTMLALKLGEDWVLDDGEAKQLETAIKRVMRHQDMQVSQKQLDYAFAAYVIATVYGTRIVATIVSKKSGEEKTDAANPPPFTAPGVMPFMRPAG